MSERVYTLAVGHDNVMMSLLDFASLSVELTDLGVAVSLKPSKTPDVIEFTIGQQGETH